VLGMAPNDPASKIRYAELLAQLRNLVVTWQISW
jgi:hypothetical protein